MKEPSIFSVSWHSLAIIGLGSKLAVLQAQQVRNITSYDS